jgi:hypothetical protein
MKIEIISRDGKYKFYTEGNNIQTVHDIKEYLTTNIKIDRNDILIFYKDYLVDDNDCISSFGSLPLQFTFETTSVNKEEIEEDQNIILEDIATEDVKKIQKKSKLDEDVKVDENSKSNEDVKLKNEMNKQREEKIKIKLKGSGTILEVDLCQTFLKDNKRYLIKNRRKIINFNQILEKFKKIKISRDDIIKILAFTMLIVTNNCEVLFILSTVFFLQMISKVFIKSHRNYSRTMTHYSRTCMMFITSLFMIDHNGF